MAFVKVASLSGLRPGEVREVSVAGEVFALCNAGGDIHALRGLCPHRNGPLGQGALHGTMLVCPWHAWEFDCVTGEHDRNPSVKVPKVAVQVEGDDIYIDAGTA